MGSGMQDNLLSRINFEKYFRVLGQLIPSATGFAVYDIEGHQLAASNESTLLGPGICLPSDSWMVSGTESRKPVSHSQPEPGITILKVPVTIRVDQMIGALLVMIEGHADNHCTDTLRDTEESLSAICECMVRECELGVELDAMAKELAERYEELNLVYETNDEVSQFEQEDDALRHLVANCLDYLDVDMVALLFEERERIFHECGEELEQSEGHQLIPQLYSELYDRLQDGQTCLVINDVTDSQRSQFVNDLPYKILCCPVINNTGTLLAMLVCIRKLSRTDFYNSDRNLLKAMSKKISKIVLTNNDSLTGLMKLHAIEKIIKRAIATSREQGVYHCFLNIDLDQLQVINDSCGRETGNRVISHTARLLKRNLRATDSIGYLNEGKFGVLLERCEPDKGLQIAENIRRMIEESSPDYGYSALVLRATVGVAAIGPDSTDIDAVLESAEIARDSAKEEGGNRIQFYSNGDQDLFRRKEHMQWVNEIQNALRDDRFRIYYQDIQSLTNADASYHFEILLRLEDENGALVGPGAFIPPAERYNLMPAIDRWVIENTFKHLSRHLTGRTTANYLAAINLSGQTLADEELVEFIEDRLQKYHIEPESICFEITETSAIGNLELATGLVSRLRSMGCSLSLDDFGTGLSSFSYLKQLPVNYLKIDGSFVRQILEDRISHAMVSSINQIGHIMQLKTIAEFVENEAIKERLKLIGVDYIQGYAIGEPKPLGPFLESIARELTSQAC
jgi:diguanylate cyclase (GGDEF)-like protein